mgnify:CR=1 FL=1
MDARGIAAPGHTLPMATPRWWRLGESAGRTMKKALWVEMMARWGWGWWVRLPSAVVVAVALLHLPVTVSDDDVCDDEASSLAVSLCCCCFCVYSLSPSPCPSPYPFLCPCPSYLGCVYAISISVAFVCPFDDEAPPPRPVLLVGAYVVVVVDVVGGGASVVVVADSNRVGAHAERIRSNEKIAGLRIGGLVVVVVGVVIVIVRAERPVWGYSLWYAWRAKALSSSVHTEILFAGGWGSRGGIDSEGCMATPLGWVHPETRRRGP